VIATKASAKIEYGRRDVFVSSYPGAASGPLAEPIAVRIRNNSDEDLTDVRTRGRHWMPGELQQWMEEVTDFVLLVDDDLAAALRDAKPEQAGEQAGLELLIVLQANDARATAGTEDAARLWLAKAETVRLIGYKRIAGRAEWNLDQRDREGLLHWLYEREEKVLQQQANLVNGKFVGEDETRLGRNVDRFVDHEPKACDHCGRVHG
jgi:hypothetical protein